MGKATIKQILGEGQYRIELSLNEGLVSKAVAQLDKLIAEGEGRVATAQEALDKAKEATHKHRQEMAGLISQVEAVQATYDNNKATLTLDLAQAEQLVIDKQTAVNDAQYQLDSTRKALKALEDEKAAILLLPPPNNVPPPELLAAIDLANAAIEEQTQTLSDLQSELTDALHTRDGLKSQLDNLELKIPAELEGSMNKVNADLSASLYNEFLINNDLLQAKLDIKAYQLKKRQVQALPTSKELTVWCADYSVDLTGDFATIDIPGELGTIPTLLKPGFEVEKAYDGQVDGVLVSLDMMSPEQAWFNLAILPYINKWKPKHRRAHITAITGELAEIELEETFVHRFNSSQGIEVTPKGKQTIKNVPFEYMDCNSYAFAVGDFVIVEFTDRDVEQPKIIGFVDNPKPCYQSGIVCHPASAEHPNGWGKPLTTSQGVPINPPLGTPQTDPHFADVELKPTDKNTPDSLLQVFGRGNGIQVGNVARWSTDANGFKDVVSFYGPISGFFDLIDVFHISWSHRTESSTYIFYQGKAINTGSLPVLTAKITTVGNQKRIYYATSGGTYMPIYIRYYAPKEKTHTAVGSIPYHLGEASLTGDAFYPGFVDYFLNTPDPVFTNIATIPEFSDDCDQLVFLLSQPRDIIYGKIQIGDTSLMYMHRPTEENPEDEGILTIQQKWLAHATGLRTGANIGYEITRIDDALSYTEVSSVISAGFDSENNIIHSCRILTHYLTESSTGWLFSVELSLNGDTYPLRRQEEQAPQIIDTLFSTIAYLDAITLSCLIINKNTTVGLYNPETGLNYTQTDDTASLVVNGQEVQTKAFTKNTGISGYYWVSFTHDIRYSSSLFEYKTFNRHFDSGTGTYSYEMVNSMDYLSNGELESITGLATGAPDDTHLTYYPMNSF